MELSKRWEQRTGAAGKALRFPLALTATYHCGAAIRSQFIVRSSLLGGQGSNGSTAHWQVQIAAGCPAAIRRALSRMPRQVDIRLDF